MSRHHRRSAKTVLYLVILGLITACAPQVPVTSPAEPVILPSPTAAPSFTRIALPSSTPTIATTATDTPSPTFTPTEAPSLTPTPEAAVLSGAGDIAVCGTSGAAKTAQLLAQIPGDIFTAGDNSNESGAYAQYANCFTPTWGQFLDRIHPSSGNHDYMTPGAGEYYRYFGDAAGQPGQGYYSYDEGAWHIVVLNSNCNDVACGSNSEQVQWLTTDLAAHPARCVLAYWHHPRFSSGISGTFGMYPFWQALYAAGAELVINGNDHDYERFAPQTPEGNADPENGIREFVVGTGGAGQRGFNDILPNSEVHQTGTFGVLKLTLYPDRYDWEFIPVEGGDFHDAGTGNCH